MGCGVVTHVSPLHRELMLQTALQQPKEEEEEEKKRVRP